MSDDKNLEDMTEEEIKDSLLYKSFFTTEDGPYCHCTLNQLDHFHSFLPDEACGKDITEMVFEEPFESEGCTVCPCQEAHHYCIKFGPEGVSFEEVEGELFDKRNLRLPNFRKY